MHGRSNVIPFRIPRERRPYRQWSFAEMLIACAAFGLMIYSFALRAVFG